MLNKYLIGCKHTHDMLNADNTYTWDRFSDSCKPRGIEHKDWCVVQNVCSALRHAKNTDASALIIIGDHVIRTPLELPEVSGILYLSGSCSITSWENELLSISHNALTSAMIVSFDAIPKVHTHLMHAPDYTRSHGMDTQLSLLHIRNDLSGYCLRRNLMRKVNGAWHHPRNHDEQFLVPIVIGRGTSDNPNLMDSIAYDTMKCSDSIELHSSLYQIASTAFTHAKLPLISITTDAQETAIRRAWCMAEVLKVSETDAIAESIKQLDF